MRNSEYQNQEPQDCSTYEYELNEMQSLGREALRRIVENATDDNSRLTSQHVQDERQVNMSSQHDKSSLASQHDKDERQVNMSSQHVKSSLTSQHGEYEPEPKKDEPSTSENCPNAKHFQKYQTGKRIPKMDLCAVKDLQAGYLFILPGTRQMYEVCALRVISNGHAKEELRGKIVIICERSKCFVMYAHAIVFRYYARPAYTPI